MKGIRIGALAGCLFVFVWLSVMWSGCAASRFINYKTSPDYPKNNTQTLDLEGFQKPVKVYFDEAGIAHIEAENMLDLMRAEGFIQARQRFFGMDVLRRIARGRLSELVGEQELLGTTSVKFDLRMRGWGMDAGAAQDVKELDAETRAMMEAFTAGINQALGMYKPLEYRLLNVEPKEWTLEDSFVLGRLNAWSVTHNWHQETSRFLLALHLGLERAQEIYGNDFWHGGTSIPDMDTDFELPPPIAEELKDIFKERPYTPWKEDELASLDLGHALVSLTGASNAWVVAGDRSESGKPILANDPHLVHVIPSMFYQIHLKAPGLDVIGATIAGLPFVLSGHNQQVAWGLTSAVADCIDLYVEKVDPENPNRYLTSAGWKEFEQVEHIIKVQDDGELIEKRFTLRRSVHGPIMNDMYPTLFPDWAPPLAIRWNTEGVAKSIAAIYKSNQATNVEELRNALLEMYTPASTFQAADIHGNIAIFANGTVPIRPNHRGTFPVPGWLEKYEWAGLYDPALTPHAAKTSGYFAHGNNLMINPNRNNMLFNIDSAPSYRYDRIAELIEKTPKQSQKSMGEIQLDVYLKRAERVAPKMIETLDAATDLNEKEAEALNILKDWDYVASIESRGTLVFFVTYRRAVMEALKDELDAHGFEFIMAQRYSTNVADLWFDRNDNPVWDDRATPDKVETRQDTVVDAFKKAVAWLHETQGSDPAKWRWGNLHDLHIKHAFGSKKAIANFVNLERIPVGGGLDSVWKSHFDLGSPNHPYRAMAGPAYREVIDLANINGGWWVVDTGVSAWPGSPHYGDQFKLWQKGEFVPMHYNWDEIREWSQKHGSVLTIE